MAKVYLHDSYDDTYLCINVTNQTSTGWHSDLNKVEQLADTTERSLRMCFDTYANKGLDEILQIAKTREPYNIVYRIDDDSTNTYEFW